MIIKQYDSSFEGALFDLMRREGEDWEAYYGKEGICKYRSAISSSLLYVALEGGELCGYCRCREDDGFGVYIYDLLVDRAHRGKGVGQLLMARVCADYPGAPTYVMSDVDVYYEEKLGYERAGSIFVVSPCAEGMSLPKA